MNDRLLVVAVGGNALLDDSGDTTFSHQFRCVHMAAVHVLDLWEAGWKVLLVHGNGPQVGFALRRSELAQHEISPLPLDYAVAESQGSIGFMFQRALYNEMTRRKCNGRTATVITQMVVDDNDPAFVAPSKPVGGFMPEDVAKEMWTQYGWQVMEDSGRGWRRVVASPEPLRAVESQVIDDLLQAGVLVIAAGGGGIAVAETADGQLHGLEAVIDKDLSAALLAITLRADALLIATGVAQVALHFNTPKQRWLDEIDVAQAQALIAANHLGKGSMQPKVEALLRYTQACPGGYGVITDFASMLPALEGKAGTRLVGREFRRTLGERHEPFF